MMNIHKEGYPTLFLATALLGTLNILLYQFLPDQLIVQNVVLVLSIIIFFFFLQFFRNPAVRTQAKPNELIAPADGKVVVIENTYEKEYLKTECTQISIFMSPINVHVNRSPIAGIVRYAKYHAGKYLVAWHPKSSTENERTTIVVEHESGTNILFRQIAGALARRIVYYVAENQVVQQGEEFGFIKFGSRVDIFVPLGTKIHVKIGDKTKGGETIIGELV